MRTLLFAATGLALLTGVAFAQEAPGTDAPPPPPPPVADNPDAPPPPPPGPGPKHGEGPRDDRGPRGGPGRDRDGPPPPPPSKAAHFRVERGDLKLDVKCADDEPMKACADVAMQLLDKVAQRP
jgi:hypothetical protein